MITVFQGEQREGRIKFTDDKDCLPADIIRFSERYFVDIDHLRATVASYVDRGFEVCVDTEMYSYENGNGTYR